MYNRGVSWGGLRQLTGRSFQWVVTLTAALLFGAVVLRALLIYSVSSSIAPILALLAGWLLLALSEPFFTRRLKRYFPFYLLVQTALVFVLLTMPDPPDFFGTLLIILSMQTMLHLSPRVGAVWLGLCAVLLVLFLYGNYRAEAFGLALIYCAGSILTGSFALALRRSQEAHRQNEGLAGQLKDANDRLSAISAQREQLALARERGRLAREMHDSVTQTVFSMSLAAQSAGLLVERNPPGVVAQLERVGALSRSALAEMKALISELPPEVPAGGLAAALRRLATDRSLPGNLTVTTHVEGTQQLSLREEQVLLRIAREALHNVGKHAHTDAAELRLGLTGVPVLEIADRGQGFDAMLASAGGGMGLRNMGEQAAEIGWRLTVDTAPGKGTRVRVERRPA